MASLAPKCAMSPCGTSMGEQPKESAAAPGENPAATFASMTLFSNASTRTRIVARRSARASLELALRSVAVDCKLALDCSKDSCTNLRMDSLMASLFVRRVRISLTSCSNTTKDSKAVDTCVGLKLASSVRISRTCCETFSSVSATISSTCCNNAFIRTCASSLSACIAMTCNDRSRCVVASARNTFSSESLNPCSHCCCRRCIVPMSSVWRWTSCFTSRTSPLILPPSASALCTISSIWKCLWLKASETSCNFLVVLACMLWSASNASSFASKAGNLASSGSNVAIRRSTTSTQPACCWICSAKRDFTVLIMSFLSAFCFWIQRSNAWKRLLKASLNALVLFSNFACCSATRRSERTMRSSIRLKSSFSMPQTPS
mmetsp:Transcript_129018/g.373313  ORF Transcript_129018/g.373313 Transcript_129018/m.373313 type:complete len:376 (-) Transcript_129018:119-1246(-)